MGYNISNLLELLTDTLKSLLAERGCFLIFRGSGGGGKCVWINMNLMSFWSRFVKQKLICLTPTSSHLYLTYIWIFISDLHGSMGTFFFACTKSNECSNRRVADRQALLRSHVMHNEDALKFVLRDKNYGEKYLPDLVFFTLNFDASRCQFWQISADGSTTAFSKAVWRLRVCKMNLAGMFGLQVSFTFFCNLRNK